MGIVLSIAFWFNLFSGWQLQSSDFFFKAMSRFQPEKAEGRPIIVAIDDKSLDRLGRISAWPRSYYVRLLETLRQGGARLVVFDVLFSEPSPDDAALAEAIKASGNVILPLAGTPSSPQRTRVGETLRFQSFLRPLPSLVQAAAGLGHANVLPDADGTVRRLPLLIESDSEEAPALSLAAARFLRLPQALASLGSARGSIPVDGFKRMIINYQGPPSVVDRPSTFSEVSFVDVIEGQVQPSHFKGKVVFLGATATGLTDDYFTPVSRSGEKMPGVEVHANTFETIRNALFLVEHDQGGVIGVILFFSLLCGLVLPHLRPVRGALVVIGVFLLYVLAATFSFNPGGSLTILFPSLASVVASERGVMLNLVYPTAALGFTFVAVILYRIVFEEAERREVTRIFGRYVSHQVVGEILNQADQGELRLGGLKRDVTVMFADIRGFTSFSEKAQPEEVVHMLNNYLSSMIAQVFRHEGMVNKFAGDNIMAVWNAPIPHSDHILRAVKAAVDAQRAMKDMQERDPSIPKVQWGIGINTGEAVAGNMGSEDRSEYTVIGDAVNLASRLCGSAPGGEVWIGSDTYELVRDEVVAAEVGPQTFKGKEEPVMVYKVLDYKREEASAEREAAAAGLRPAR